MAIIENQHHNRPNRWIFGMGLAVALFGFAVYFSDPLAQVISAFFTSRAPTNDTAVVLDNQLRQHLLIAGGALVLLTACMTIVALRAVVALRMANAFNGTQPLATHASLATTPLINTVLHSDTLDVEKEKRFYVLQELVSLLVSLIDRRDPHAARHSAQVARLAAATARALKLDEITIDTTETAARLMNLGKIDFPPELFTQHGELHSKERDHIRFLHLRSASMISAILFEGPVATTIRQSREAMDGSGPLKLKGEAILISARIIAVANATVGMLSPRAYRQAMGIEQAIEQLHADARFDAHVVATLAGHLRNRAESYIAALQSDPHEA